MKRSILAIFLTFTSFSVKAEIVSEKSNLMYKARYDNYSKNSAQINQENLDHLKKFVGIEVEGRSNTRINEKDRYDAKFLNPRSARDVLSTLRRHPVVSLYSYKKYDPKNQGIGFCFGRAMFIHLELAMRNLDRDSIKKAFVVGSMSTGDGNSWGWHVTTIAQSKDAEGNEIWLALDPITGVMSLENWYKEMYNNYSTDKNLRIYVTESGKFGPTQDFYNSDGLKNDFYNNYFNDLEKEFEAASKRGAYDTPLKEYNLN